MKVKLNNKIKLKEKKGYSLFEVVVTLTIVTILMVMLTNTLLLSLEISRKSLARSNLREEQNDILNRISKDIRNAHLIRFCGEDALAAAPKCEVLLDKKYTWTTCSGDRSISICKKVGEGTEEEILESTSENLVVKQFTIEEGIVEAYGKKSIVITLIVNHKLDTIDIEDQVRQVVISTRNYSV